MSEHVRLEVRDSVLWITLDRPEKLNALSDAMLDALLAAVARLASEPDLRVGVITGSGRAFSAGADIAGLDAASPDAFAATIARFMRLSKACHDCDRVVIAAVNGFALAGGFELALMCDVRIAARSARFGLPDTALGLSPTSGMTWLLPRIVGFGRALDMTLFGEPVDAAQALQIGLVTTVVEDADLLAEAERRALILAQAPAIGVFNTKRGFRAALDNAFERQLAFESEREQECFASPETRARLSGFVRRKR